MSKRPTNRLLTVKEAKAMFEAIDQARKEWLEANPKTAPEPTSAGGPRTDQTAQGEASEKAVAAAMEIVAECVNCPYGKIWLPAWQVEGHRAAGHDVRRVEGKA